MLETPRRAPRTPTRSWPRGTGRRRATQLITTNFEHIPAELLAHTLLGAACERGTAADRLRDARGLGRRRGEDHLPGPDHLGHRGSLLAWPAAAARFRKDWVPHADWVELDGVGHCPQLDVPLETAELILGFTSR